MSWSSSHPIFFDPSGRRGLWSRRLVSLLLASILLLATALATTLIVMPHARDLELPFERARPDTLELQAARVHRALVAPFRSAFRWMHFTPSGRAPAPLMVGFYTPFDEASAEDLRAHIHSLDWVVPSFVTVAGRNAQVSYHPDPRFVQVMAAAGPSLKVLPMVQNLNNDEWDGANTARNLANPQQRDRLVHTLAAAMTGRHCAGLVLDFEDLPDHALPDYIRFLRALNTAMPTGSTLAVTVSAGEDSARLRALAHVADKLILMAYDEHWQTGSPGPIASQNWFVTKVGEALRDVGKSRLIVALGGYAYDWHDGSADATSVEEAWLAAHDSGTPITFDHANGNAGFAYDEGNGASRQRHEIWMLDAAANQNELIALHHMGLDQVALWRLGTEDNGFWNALTASRVPRRTAIPNLRKLLPAHNVDVEGQGEVLRISDTRSVGERRVRFGADGSVIDEQYEHLPTPLVVERTGARPKLLALTFDDGPDPDWTPLVLSALEKAHVPATFFVIGENALQHPGLLRRIVADGDELGNHTYTHPNLALDGAAATKLELNATQRLIEAYTGRAMRLFRAPYFGDAEPTTTDEIDPALIAQQLGYTIIGLHVDPGDWKTPGLNAIVQRTVDQVTHASSANSGNIILLHDGGGNRAQTVAALPRIINTLEARGYRFVPVSTLVGLPRSAVMPVVKGRDLLAVRTDIAIFLLLAGTAALLKWLFFAAITLGICRALLMTALATAQTRRRRATPPDYWPSVSVIIPAFNEERVIEASLVRVLASEYPHLSVIVADDGSRDATSAIVAKRFSGDPRVKLLTLSNGGKAAALNRALREAEGEVIIALDADTQFEPRTIGQLARWFANPAIGAVAGDARVGNRINLATRWQAVEYITAQNLERRALAAFGAMTVVPGAVGAWRRTALDSVGGYPEDTLAEDQDLTIAIQRAGWRVTYDPRAVAWTEAPESFTTLARQRFRWAFGTLQCLWKHRVILRTRRPTGLALIGLPQAWLFQIFFAAISPIIDLTLLLSLVGTCLKVFQHGWAQTQSDFGRMALYWVAFMAVDVACGAIAYRLDGNRARYQPLLLVAQRFIYRQIMYWVVVRAIWSALGGRRVGWGKLARSGSVDLGSNMRQSDDGNQAGAIILQRERAAVKAGDAIHQSEAEPCSGHAA